jgi:hypothetical protein
MAVVWSCDLGDAHNVQGFPNPERESVRSLPIGYAIGFVVPESMEP